MPIVKRRLDICGREKSWEYVVDAAGSRHQVSVRQVGREVPSFSCTCCDDPDDESTHGTLFQGSFVMPCAHVVEVERDLNIARQAVAQMVS